MQDQPIPPGPALVIGARGGIGAALLAALRAGGAHDPVIGLSRPSLDLADDHIATAVAALPAPPRLVINAAGFLHGEGQRPEKSLPLGRRLARPRAFAVNATGPALLMKHLLPRLPRRGRAVFACLSARVGGIGDDRLGGWYTYRASKAALNRLVHTAAIGGAARTHPEAICVALHPGTVATPLSAPFAGDTARPPAEAAADLLRVLDGLRPRTAAASRLARRPDTW